MYCRYNDRGRQCHQPAEDSAVQKVGQTQAALCYPIIPYIRLCCKNLSGKCQNSAQRLALKLFLAEASELRARNLPCHPLSVLTMARPQQLRVVRLPSAGIAEYQIAAGIDGAVQTEAPFASVSYGI